MTTPTDFAATYAQMPDGELARVLRGKRFLVPDARAALDNEIQKRNLDPSQLRKRRPHSIDKRRKPTILEQRMKGKWLSLPWALTTMALSVVLFAVLLHFGHELLFWPVAITLIVPIFTVWGFWELKGRPWFWCVIALVVAANAVLFSLAGWPWGTRHVPAQTLAGLCTVESIPIFALIARLHKRIDRNQDGRPNPTIPEPHTSPADKIEC